MSGYEGGVYRRKLKSCGSCSYVTLSTRALGQHRRRFHKPWTATYESYDHVREVRA